MVRLAYNFNNAFLSRTQAYHDSKVRSVIPDEVSRFDKAVRTAERITQLTLAGGKRKLAKDIQGRLDLYKAKRPYRESFSPEGLSTPELRKH